MNKPNVLIFLIDQQRFDTIKAAGYDHMITPNLDKLASESCLYTHAHTHNPVCMPARHDLLLGMPASAHGYFANRGGAPIKDYSIPTLPRLFSEAGYRTAAIGKMHFAPKTMHHGYGEMYLMEELPKHRQDDAYASYLKTEGYQDVMNLHGVRPLIYHEPQESQMPMEHYETSWLKNRTIEWLDENDNNPFMLCVGYIKPHPPWDIPASYQGIYKDKDLPEPSNRSRQFPANPEENPWFGDMDDQDHKRAIREAYFTSITMVDDSVGQIIEHLRQTKQLDNTLIIYTSDHGEMLQDKGYYSKNMPYDSAVRVPMIVRYPDRFEPGSRSDQFVDLLDILPTCLDVAGIKYPDNGHDLYGESLCAKSPVKNRDTIITANGFLGNRRWVSARNKQFKYIYWHNGGTEELYDLVKDPKEVYNCMDDHYGSLVHESLRQAVTDYEINYGPEGAVVNDVLAEMPAEPWEPWIGSKYPIWLNSQFQHFYKGNRKEQFAKELVKALGRDVKKGYDTLDNDYWQGIFKEGLKGYID